MMMLDINNAVFCIAPIADNEVYFPDVISKYLEQYILFLIQDGIGQEDISVIQRFKQNICMCLQEYYCGQHSSARVAFDLAIRNIHIEDAYTPLQESTFYRVRKEKVDVLSSYEMFHIPYEKCFLVRTQRFSYPGLPCLYLGASVDVCSEEIRDWSDNLNIAQIELVSAEKPYILDMTFFERYNFDALTPVELSRFVRLWPLVACCSFLYLNTEKMMFRPDYVLPQLLLEHIVDRNTCIILDNNKGTRISGIKYRSVRAPYFGNNDIHRSSRYINYVFPAVPGQKAGHCSELKDMFSVIRIAKLKDF